MFITKFENGLALRIIRTYAMHFSVNLLLVLVYLMTVDKDENNNGFMDGTVNFFVHLLQFILLPFSVKEQKVDKFLYI